MRKGQKMPEEVKLKIGNANKGNRFPNRKLTETHKANIALARKREWAEGKRKRHWHLKPEQIEKVRQANLGRITPLEVRKKQSLTRLNNPKTPRGDCHYGWKGDDVGYIALHQWISRNLGKPDTCEFCGKTGFKRHFIHWANKSGLYLRAVSDWIRLCAKCHKEFDAKRRNKK